MSEEYKSDFAVKNNAIVAEQSVSPAVSITKTGAMASLLIPNFRWLLTGNLLTSAIMWIQQVIISWLIYNQTGSGTLLGSTVLVSSAAALLMLPAVGILVDSINRRLLMGLLAAGNVLLTLGMGFILLTGHNGIIFLFVFIFICGLLQSVDSNVRQVLVFDLVPRSQTPAAMAVSQTGWSVMRVVGPSLGGFLLIWFGAGGSFLAQAGGFLIVGITILLMKIPDRKKAPKQSSPFQNIKEGTKYLISQPVIRAFTLIGIIMPILVIPVFGTLPPIYAVQVFGDDSGRVLGFLMASVGVGGVIGGVATAYLRRIEHWGRLQLASLFLVSLALIAFAYCSILWLALVLLVLAGFFEIIFLTMNMTLIQLSIPDNLRARVTAVVSLTWILSPLGNIIAGAGSDILGGPEGITIILACATTAMVILILIFSPTVRNYRLSQGISTPG